jgi:hypothetical protein
MKRINGTKEEIDMHFDVFILLAVMWLLKKVWRWWLWDDIPFSRHPSRSFFPPPIFSHLTLKQWLQHRDSFGRPYHVGTKKRRRGNIFEWLEQEGLPPIPREKYDPVTGKWVAQMPQAQREAYLNSLNVGKLHLMY